LVAGGGDAVSPPSLAADLDLADSAVKAWVYRRRQKFGDDVLPRGAKDASGYRLAFDRDEVDAWWLLDRFADPIDSLPDDRLIGVLRPGKVLDEFDTPAISRCRREIRRSQRHLVVEVVRADRRSVMTNIVSLVDELLADSPFDEDLAWAHAQLQAELVGRRQGLQSLNETRIRLREVGLEPGDELRQLEAVLLGVEAVADPLRATTETADLPLVRPRELPMGLADLRTGPYLERGALDLIDMAVEGGRQSDSAGWVVVAGPTGLGKGRYVAELAAVAFEAGAAVFHLEPFAFGPEPWQNAFRACFPSVDQFLADFDGSRLDAETFRTVVVRAVRTALIELSRAGPVVVVVTQAHQLGSEAIAAFWYLLRTPMPSNVAFVLTGDTSLSGRGLAGLWSGHGVSAAWQSFVDGVGASGSAQLVELPMLDVEQVEQLVRFHCPDFGRNRSLSLSRWIVETSGGLPGLALPLVLDAAGQRESPETFQVPSTDPLRRFVSSLPEQAQIVGAAAAVCGMRFAVDDVEALLQMPREMVADGLARLFIPDLIVAEGLAGRYRFATLPLAQMLAGSAPPEQLDVWHRRAAELFADDPVRKARHLAAVAIDGPAVRALTLAAQVLVEAGQYHEAVATFERVAQLSSRPFPVSACVEYVRALDLSGRHEEAAKVRGDAFDEALLNDEQSTALKLLLASWPEAEAFAESGQLASSLEAVDTTGLNAEERVLHACHLSRHLSLDGRVEAAQRVVVDATPADPSIDERASLMCAMRYAHSSTSAPALCHELLGPVRPHLADLSVAKRIEVLIWSAVDAYELGATEELEGIRGQLHRHKGDANPVQLWQTHLLDAVVAADNEDVEGAQRHRRSGFEHALGSGIRHALSVQLAAELAEQFLSDLPYAVADKLQPESVALLDENPPLLDAGMALMLERNGRLRAARETAEQVLDYAEKHPNRRSAPSVALITSILTRVGDDGLSQRATDLLLRRGNVMLLAGLYISGLGPTTHYAAMLAAGADERDALRREARLLAERSGSIRWLRLTGAA
jgi:tetratricopeptide (TPR) repeat protein